MTFINGSDGMMKFNSTEAVKQCLTDAGCEEETIAAFLRCMKASDISGELALLESQRAHLLDHIHQTQFCIALVDNMLDRAEHNCL